MFPKHSVLMGRGSGPKPSESTGHHQEETIVEAIIEAITEEITETITEVIIGEAIEIITGDDS